MSDFLGGIVNQFLNAHQQAAPDQVESAATDHFTQSDPGEFQQSVQEGVANVPRQQVGGLVGTILGALEQAGIPAGQVAQDAGPGSASPAQANHADLSNLLGYAQKYAPGVLGSLVANYPQLGQVLGGGVLKGLLGRLSG